MRILFALCSLGMAIAAASALAPTSSTAQAQKVPASERATWQPSWDAKFGMNESQFQELGMNKLTSDQASRLFALLVANQPSFTCYKFYPESQKDELKHVHLYVESETDKADKSAELVGRLRTQLSAIRDVNLVYSERDADFVIGIIAFDTVLSNGRETGYAASVVLTQPCVYISNPGPNKGVHFSRMYAHHYLAVGSTQDEAASTIANILDARAFDDMRRVHAAQLSAYENK